MQTPIAALTWEIWRRGRKSAWLGIGCLCLCASINLATPEHLRATEVGQALFPPLFGLLMVLCFLLVMGIFNYTEFSASREWNGFPYRLFCLPLRTWQLVLTPMLLGVIAIELIYAAWIKLVWTHEHPVMTQWFGVLLGAYMIFYQAVLWNLAGFRVLRVIALSVGGVSSIAVASLPILAKDDPSSWFSQRILIPVMIGLGVVTVGITWQTVARQRCGGGQRQNWLRSWIDAGCDALPRRRTEFASPAAAQQWFEWRRSGLLLPACIAFALATCVAPLTWLARNDPKYTSYLLVRLLILPVVLSYWIGKGFIKPEFWSTNLSLPAFLATKPFASGDFIVTKLRVAALSVIFCWLLIGGFVALWLPLWGDTAQLQGVILELRQRCPDSWLAILTLGCAGLVVITWRFLVNGLWSGLSGRRLLYVGSLCVQVGMPAMLLLAGGIWSDSIDAQLREHPAAVESAIFNFLAWTLGLMVIGKFGLAAFAWSQISRSRRWQFWFLWAGITTGFIALAILALPAQDLHHLGLTYVFGALLLVPLARLGLAPRFLGTNRHG